MQKIGEDYNLGMFFEISEDFLCIAGYDGYFKRANPAFLKLMGYSEEEIFSRPIDEFVFSEDQGKTNLQRENLINNTSLLNFENRYLTKKGDVIWLSWTSIPLSKEKLVYAIAKDITIKKQIEEERYQLLTKLSNSNNDLKQLSYRTSHDLRSRVNNIMALTDLIDTSKIQDQDTLEVIELLKFSAEGIKDNLNEFVDNLTVKDNNHFISLEDLDIIESLQSVKKLISSLISNSKTTFSTDFSAVKTIKFNKVYLESIFLNLITNSIKYTKPNHAPEISICSKKNDDDIQIIFTDKGLGFDMEKDKNKIFGLNQKFHHHIDSKGVGLYLIYNYISSLGGQIEVESRLNEGATFIITIPN
ncbi:PAS domain-containing sensor histidine kinase [Flavobacteriaceae bacterium KMM 6897]|nr:PAS domain-containing sensor histidine kinase [Flavobacteriaceae bacterium KMM 6897]